MADAFPLLSDEEVRAMGEGRVIVRSVAMSADLEAARAHLQPAGVGKDRAVGVRGDRIAWIDDIPALAELRTWFESGTRVLTDALRMRLDRVEIQVALYAPGAAYSLHQDTFANDPARRVTAILYMNEGWELSWGGELRAHEPSGIRDIAPTAGTLVLFSSPHLRHEVLTAHHERWAVTGWYGRG